MSLKVGCDIIEIDRVKKAAENPAFIDRWFTTKEKMLFAERKFAPQTIAGNFAAKEAFVKALGTGFVGISLRDIEVLRDAQGKPFILCKKQPYPCDVSISHCEEYATATVIMER